MSKQHNTTFNSLSSLAEWPRETDGWVQWNSRRHARPTISLPRAPAHLHGAAESVQCHPSHGDWASIPPGHSTHGSCSQHSGTTAEGRRGTAASSRNTRTLVEKKQYHDYEKIFNTWHRFFFLQQRLELMPALVNIAVFVLHTFLKTISPRWTISPSSSHTTLTRGQGEQ